MRKLATAFLVLLGLSLLAANGFALDLRRHSMPSNRQVHLHSPAMIQAVLGCDDGYVFNAYYQNSDDRLGNYFSFGATARLSRVAFAHYGFGFSGPYQYNLEVWDPASCTFVTGKNGLVAQDAASDVAVEDVDLCSDNIMVSGYMMIMIDPNSCLAPDDCYPDLMFDDQVDVACPVIINNASTAPECFDISPYSGPFLLRVETDNCPVPAKKTSWGELKTLYR
ncbi:MAG TPA: hypothetical protein VMJ70_00640 [Candidatus Sulfotelmatobacter sp.]|nr:hypothetical protein [Candidatus Sulfotelmatobacter sp.]